jgi:uncharacterized protein
MKSRVYFIKTEDADDIAAVNDRLEVLINSSKVLGVVGNGEKVAVKMHFGEEGNVNYVRADHVRMVCDEIKRRGASPVLADANTLYRGKRLNSKDHLAIAYEHGFTKDAVGADIFIPDDTRDGDAAEVQINQSHIKTAKVGRFFVDAHAIVAVSHFKGHGLTGFGGAIKNIGMGCGMREGKLAQHCDASPAFYAENCKGCGECALVCPVGAVRVENDKAVLDKGSCIGCASCVAACPNMGLFIDFKAGEQVQVKMAEYALAVLANKQGKAAFITLALRVSKECDCWGWENPIIGPDVGIFASLDPVAIDKASYDVVNRACGKDIFKEAHAEADGFKQLQHAQDIGLGSMDYELIEL